MRDPARIDRVVEKLRTLWHAHPDMRLGQLVENLRTSVCDDTFQVEDDVWERNVDAVLRGGFDALWDVEVGR